MNIKYSFILIISVFLSLGIGIVIGISLESKDILEKQHSVIAQRLGEEFAGIRNENRQLKDGLSELEKSKAKAEGMCQSIFNAVIKNKLKGLKVALIEIGDEKTFSDLIGLLKMSGASIESNITLNPKLFKEEQNISEIFRGLSARSNGKEREAFKELAINTIDSLLDGELSPIMYKLNEEGFLYNPIHIQESCDAIVLSHNDVADQNDKNLSEFILQFAKSARDYHIPVVIVENMEDRFLDLNECKKLNVSTIDHIDTIFGKLSLVSLLHGDRGNFGLRDGTEGVLPTVIFPNSCQDKEESDDDAQRQ